MKKRPVGFLAEDKIDHKSEIFDYIRECHEYLWYFIRENSLGISSNLGDNLDFDPNKKRMLNSNSCVTHTTHGDEVENAYKRVEPFVEKMKKNYDTPLEGLEPALTNDIAEIVLHFEKQARADQDRTTRAEEIKSITHAWNMCEQKLNGTLEGAVKCIETFRKYLTNQYNNTV